MSVHEPKFAGQQSSQARWDVVDSSFEGPVQDANLLRAATSNRTYLGEVKKPGSRH